MLSVFSLYLDLGIPSNNVNNNAVVRAETSEQDSNTLSNLVSTKLIKGILTSSYTDSSAFTVDASVPQDKLPAIQALKDAYDKLPDSYKRIVQGVHFVNQEDGIIGSTTTSRHSYIRANYIHPDTHPDFSDAYDMFFHEIAHSIDFLTYSNVNGQEYSISRSAELSGLLSQYSSQPVNENFAATFGGWLQSKVIGKQPKDGTESSLWALYDKYLYDAIFNTPQTYTESQLTTFNWIGLFKDEQGNSLRDSIELTNNYNRDTIYEKDNAPSLGNWVFKDRVSKNMDDLGLRENKVNYLWDKDLTDAWSTFTVPGKLGDKYLFKRNTSNFQNIGLNVLYTWQDIIFNEPGKQGKYVSNTTTFYYKAKDGKITLRLVDADNPSTVYATNEQTGFKNYDNNKVDTTVFDSYKNLGEFLDTIPSQVTIGDEDVTIDIRVKREKPAIDISDFPKHYDVFQWDNVIDAINTYKNKNEQVKSIELLQNVDTSVVTKENEPLQSKVKITLSDGNTEEVPITVSVSYRTIHTAEQQWRTIEYRKPDGTKEFHYQAILDYYKSLVDFKSYKLPYSAVGLNETHTGVRYLEDADNAYYTDKLTDFQVPQYDGYISYVNGVPSKTLPEFSSKSASSHFNDNVRVGNFLEGTPTQDELDKYSHRVDSSYIVEYKEDTTLSNKGESDIVQGNLNSHFAILVRDNTDTVTNENTTSWKRQKDKFNNSFAPFLSNNTDVEGYKSNGALWGLNASNIGYYPYAYGEPNTIGEQDYPKLKLGYSYNTLKTKYVLDNLHYDGTVKNPIVIKPALSGYRTFVGSYLDVDALSGSNGIQSLLKLDEVGKDTEYKFNTHLSDEQLNKIKEYFSGKSFNSYSELEDAVNNYIKDNFTSENINDFKNGSDKLYSMATSYFFNIKFPDSNPVPQEIKQGDTVDYTKSIDNYEKIEVIKGIDNKKLGTQTATIKVYYSDGSFNIKEAPITVVKSIVDKNIPVEYKRVITVNLPNGEKDVVTQVIKGTKPIKVNKYDDKDIISEGDVVLDGDTFDAYKPKDYEGFTTPEANKQKVDLSKPLVELELNYEKVNNTPTNPDDGNTNSGDGDTNTDNGNTDSGKGDSDSGKDDGNTNNGVITPPKDNSSQPPKKDLTDNNTDKQVDKQVDNSDKNVKKDEQTGKSLPKTNYNANSKLLTFSGLGIITIVLSALGFTKLKKKQNR